MYHSKEDSVGRILPLAGVSFVGMFDAMIAALL